METQRGRTIPVVKEFHIDGCWVPPTPAKPNVARQRPIYDDGQGGLLSQAWGEQGSYLSRYTQQNDPHTLLPYSVSSAERSNYPSTSSNVWGRVHETPSMSGRMQLERENNEVRRRGLEEYLPHWSSHGRRSVANYGSNLSTSSYPRFSSWDLPLPWNNNGVRESGVTVEGNFNDSLGNFNTMAFGDLLGINGTFTMPNNRGESNGVFSPGLVSQAESSPNNVALFENQDALRRFNQQSDRLYDRGMLNGALQRPFGRMDNHNLPPTPKRGNGRTAFAPETPDSWQKIQRYDMASGNLNLGTNEVLQEHYVTSKMVDLNKDSDSEPIKDSSPGKVPIGEEDNQNPEKRDIQDIDLNKTPAKKPRRRRYQPKVIRENKPKSTPKPKTPYPKADDSKDNQVKRTSVRKDKTNTPSTTPKEPAEPKPEETAEPIPKEPPVKSCKKSLNFDLNGHFMPEEELMLRTPMAAYDLNHTMNQELNKYISLPDMNMSTRQETNSPGSLSRRKDKCGNTKDSFSAQRPNSSPCGSSSEGVQTRGSKRSLSYAPDRTYIDIGIGAITQSTPWQNHSSPKTTHAEILPQNFIPNVCKKKRSEIQRLHIQGTSSSTVTSENISQLGKANSQPQVRLETSKYYYGNTLPFGINRMTNNQPVLMRSSENREQFSETWADLSRLKKKRTKVATRVRDLAPFTGIASPTKSQYPCNVTLNGIFSCTEALAADTGTTPKSKRISKKPDILNKNWNMVPYGTNYATTAATDFNPGLPWRKRSSTVEHVTMLFQQLDINRENSQITSKEKALVPYGKRHQNIVSDDQRYQNALVPYEKGGFIVPFEGPFNPLRKRRPRARVDLDDETTRVWRLLLENIDNEGIDGTDEDKAKWWDNERSVFRGRVDSFIARMRLVQGDRRFTPWKGSVLDSVIGVFLTQNVSDHLSSSAFMSMAARFPLKPESSKSNLSEESNAIFVEPEIYIFEPEENITWNEKVTDQQTLGRNSNVINDIYLSEEKEVVNSKESTTKADSLGPTEWSNETCEKAPNNSRAFSSNCQTIEEETPYILDYKATSSQQSVFSSQNSNSPNLNTVGIMNTFSESNSKTQIETTGSKLNYLESTASFMGLLKMTEFSSQTHLEELEGMEHLTEYFQEAPFLFSSNYQLNPETGFHFRDVKGIEMIEAESRSSPISRKDENSPTEQSNLTLELVDQEQSPDTLTKAVKKTSWCYVLEGETMVVESQMQKHKQPPDYIASSAHKETSPSFKGINVTLSSQQMADVTESTRAMERTKKHDKQADQIPKQNYASAVLSDMVNTNPSVAGKGKAGKGKRNEFDWDSLRRDAQVNGKKPVRTANTKDSLDWEAVRHADVSEIAETIKERGMNNMLAERIKALLDRLVVDHGSIDMEWLRDIPPDKAKEYLLSFRGLGLKSVECVRLLTLHHLAFPVDTNVGRIAVRLGWVPLQPLPESLQLHLLEMYPILESIQKYLWPRLCKLDQKTLYELHYHMITFGKVFCTKRQPNCNACPLRGECRHFASAFASARFGLPGPEEKSIVPSSETIKQNANARTVANLLPPTTSWAHHNLHPHSLSETNDANHVPSFPLLPPFPQNVHLERKSVNSICEPIVEVPASPEQEPQHEQELCDIEDYEDPNEIPTIDLNMEEFTKTLQNFMRANREAQEAGVSNALVALTPEAASIPTPKLKNINRLRTEHYVYELPDTHPLLHGLEKREPDDPCSYLLAIWTPGETANSIDPPARTCSFNDPNMLCNEETCSYCNSQRETDSQIVRGTLLIPTRTAMRGSFPLNGTYFQVNEVFADHDSSLTPIAVPRSWLWNLPRRTVYFGTSIPSIFKGLNTEDIQHCFWRGYVCVRGFDQKTRSPRPLMARLHFPASRLGGRGAKGKVYDE